MGQGEDRNPVRPERVRDKSPLRELGDCDWDKSPLRELGDCD